MQVGVCWGVQEKLRYFSVDYDVELMSTTETDEEKNLRSP